MLHEAIHQLNIQPNGTYIDLTFGGGSHTQAILNKLSSGKLIAFDQDQAAYTQAQAIQDPRLTFVQANFRFLKNFITSYNITKVNGIIADLGTSSHQLNQPQRGFAARLQGPLDMRMNQESTLTASQLINTYHPQQLITILREYGEIHNAPKLVTTILKARSHQPINTTSQLLELLTPLAPKQREYKYFAKVFQALRIAVNDELTALQDMLLQIPELLKPQGRLVILSYHSLEDRLIKRFIKTGNFQGNIIRDTYGNLIRPLKPLHNKPLKPTPQEITNNNRARSARLRTATPEQTI